MGGASRAATGDPRHLVCGEKTGRLDVDVLLEDERQLQEAFAGIGSGEDGLQDALRNFASNSFHVLLSALWGQAEEDQVMVETWEIGERRFEVHIGNLGLRGAEGKAPPLPAGLFPSIERAIRTEPLDARLHWFRHFFCAFGNQRTVEALFDNQPWRPACRTWLLSTGRIRRVTTACATSSCSSRWRRPPRRPSTSSTLPHDQHCDDPAAPGRRDDAESFFIGKRRHDFQMRRAQD